MRKKNGVNAQMHLLGAGWTRFEGVLGRVPDPNCLQQEREGIRIGFWGHSPRLTPAEASVSQTLF